MKRLPSKIKITLTAEVLVDIDYVKNPETEMKNILSGLDSLEASMISKVSALMWNGDQEIFSIDDVKVHTTSKLKMGEAIINLQPSINIAKL